MKTNMINTNSVIKSICAVVMLLGMSVSAWGAKTGTIEFGNSPKVAIGSASASGADSQGNTWTITTVGTTSYTGQTDYYQVGSSSKPATSITFTMTLPSSKNITAFSAKFGGFGDTAGTIKLKVGDTEVGSGSLNGTSDVTVSNSSTASGTVLTVTVTSISKGVKCYYISCTYANTSAYTVTFDAEGGTCATSSLTEASIDGGVILPAATANAASYGWGFYGWAESAVSTIASSAPIVGKAGDTYYPSGATTLHAVFAKGEYTLIKSTSEITSGEKFLIGGFDYNNDKMYVMTDDYKYDDNDEAYYMSGHLLGTSPSETYSAADINANWRYIINYESGKYYIKNNADTRYIDVDLTNWVTNTKYSSDYYTFTINSSNGYTVIKNNYASRYLVLYVGGDFGRYTSDDPWDAMLIYKETVTPTYCSNPSAVRLVASPAAGGTVVFDDNSSDEMDFADEYIGDITATPNSGYDFLNWESSVSGSDIEIDPTVESEAAIDAKTSATITAHFYQKRSISYILTEGGVAGEVGNPTTVTKTEKDGFVVGFNLQAHYKDMTLVSVTMGGSPMTEGSGADYEWEVEDGTAMLTIHHANIDGDIVITVSATHMEYTKYAFSCADLQLDEPANGADNVVSTVVYLTSTNGQKVRSLAHFRVHGDGLTASQTVKFTTGDDDLDELYTFRKADGTEVATNSSGVVDEEVYIFYQPTTTTDGRDVATSVKAYVERKGDGSGKPKAVVNDERTINGRHLPSQFIIAAKSGGVWYALPSDASVTGAQMGYTFTANNTTTPTKATVAPQTALYSIYAPRADGTNKSYVRFASTNDGKTLWSNNSTSKIGIKDNAAVDGPSSKGDQYEWRLENTSADSYKLWNNASYDGAGRYLGLSGTKWNVYETNVSIVQDLKILPVEAISDYIGLEATEWEETAFSFTITSGSEPDPYDHVVVGYNGKNYDASISGTKLTITDADFVTDGGFGAASGSQLIVAWCDDEDVVLAQGSVLSPIIVNSNTVNLSEYDSEELSIMDVFITNGAKLTINESTTVHNVTVNPGATLFVNETDGGDAVTMQLYNGKLMLRGGWTTISGDAAYDMPRVYINPLSTLTKTNTNVNFDISVDKRNYYPFAVPFRVRVKDVNYANPTLRAAATYGTHYVIKEYSGKLRADNGPDRENNWVVVPQTDPESGEDVYLEPGKGYILTAVSIPAYGGGIIRFPMSFANAWTTLGEQGSVSATTKNVIEVTAHEGAATSGGGANNRHKGWNMLGVPFMSCYTSGTDMYDGEGSADLMTGRMTLTGDPADPYGWETGDVVYVSVPSHDFAEYVQTDIEDAKLLPGWSFFVQVNTSGNLTFAVNDRRPDEDNPIYAPKRGSADEVVRTGIILSDGEASDKTTILISDQYSGADYEIGADLEKMFGNGYTLATYSLSGSTRLAYNAMSKSDATAVIPIGYRAPAEGEYTYSLNPRYAEANFERVDLIDYQTGSLTNLMTSSYTFTTGRTQDDSRFALNVVMKPTITTDVENGANGENDANGVEKVIINDHMYIIRSGQMYDATGKTVREINK